MKTLVITLMIMAFTRTSAQFSDGQKVLTTTVSYLNAGFAKGESRSSTNPSIVSKSNGFLFSPEFTYGKIKNNQLFSYGLSILWGMQKTTVEGTSTPEISQSRVIGFAPVISYEKFYFVSNKVYFTPFTRFTLEYQRRKQWSSLGTSTNFVKEWTGVLDFYPFSITFAKSAKTNFLFRAGAISLYYDRGKTYTTPTSGDNSSISSDLSLTAQLNTIAIGIQKIF